MRRPGRTADPTCPGRTFVNLVITSAILGLGLCNGPAASAAPILFSFEGRAVGTLDGDPFGGFFGIEVAADTNDVSVFGAAISDIFHVDGDATIELSLGAGRFSSPARITSTQPLPIGVDAAIGFGVFGDLLTVADPAINGYLLDGAFGPVISTTPGLVIRDVQLDIGLLRFTSISHVTFTATPIPEPSTALLVASGLLGLCCLRNQPPRTQSRYSTTSVPAWRPGSRAPWLCRAFRRACGDASGPPGCCEG